MPPPKLDYGDIPTWIATIGAIVAAVAAWRVFLVERRRDRDAAAGIRRYQAEKVSAWVAGAAQVEPASAAEFARVIVSNASDLPVYDVSVRFEHRGSETEIDTLPILPPGERASVVIPAVVLDWARQLPARHRDPLPINEFRAAVSFRDAANRRWDRDTFGVLREGSPPA